MEAIYPRGSLGIGNGQGRQTTVRVGRCITAPPKEMEGTTTPGVSTTTVVSIMGVILPALTAKPDRETLGFDGPEGWSASLGQDG